MIRPTTQIMKICSISCLQFPDNGVELVLNAGHALLDRAEPAIEAAKPNLEGVEAHALEALLGLDVLQLAADEL